MLTLKLRRTDGRSCPADVKSQISNLKSLAESCSRQLCGWADSLQNSDIQGQRHLTDKARRISHARAEREEFLQRLQRIREGKEKP